MDNEKENKEIEFDPSESEAFYENLDAALGLDNDSFEAEPELPEISGCCGHTVRGTHIGSHNNRISHPFVFSAIQLYGSQSSTLQNKP